MFTLGASGPALLTLTGNGLLQVAQPGRAQPARHEPSRRNLHGLGVDADMVASKADVQTYWAFKLDVPEP